MSTEHQKYSTANQADAIRAYAERRAMAIVRTYEDAGKSGLDIEGREALRQLIADVQGGEPGFEAILVYDISRWGRFQDADESAHYEYLCRRAGISVHYCAEQFDNDGSPISTIVKGVKRAMAGEYSRELSQKTFAGQCRLAEMGYHSAGPPGYGLRRMQIDEHGNRKGILARHEHKNRLTDRVILVPGPREERAIIRRIFRLFVDRGRTKTEIARLLNSKGLTYVDGRPWSLYSVNKVLTNEKYIGTSVFNRTTGKLKAPRVRNPATMWIRKERAFDPIVDHRLFLRAQALIRRRAEGISNEAILAHLKSILRECGHLNARTIDRSDRPVNTDLCCKRFGGLRETYELIGFKLDRNYAHVDINRRLRRYRLSVISGIHSGFEARGGCVVEDPVTGILSVNEEFTVSTVIARHWLTAYGYSRWVVRLNRCSSADLTVAVRMDYANESALDYYLFPRGEFCQPSIRLREENGAILDAYRFETLDCLFQMAERVKLKEAA